MSDVAPDSNTKKIVWIVVISTICALVLIGAFVPACREYVSAIFVMFTRNTILHPLK